VVINSRWFNSAALTSVLFYPVVGIANGIADSDLNYNEQLTPIPAACTFQKLYVKGLQQQGSAAGSDTINVTLYKNGVAQALTASVTVSSTAVVTGTDLTHTVSVAAGDTVAWGMTQNNVAPTVIAIVSAACQ
jgi:hypothetical protein